MGNDHQETPEVHRDTNRVKIIFSIIITCVLFLLELYEMINAPQNFIVLGVLAVVMLFAIYISAISLLKESQKNLMRKEEQYQNIFKSEKASYLILRKSFDDVQRRLEQLERELKLPADDIVTAQKAIAKVTISRSKENTDALMNSNDKLMERVLKFEDELANNNELMLEKQKDIIASSNKDVFIKQQEILASLKEMELSIRNQVLESSKSVPVVQQVTKVQQPENVIESEPEVDNIARNEAMLENEIDAPSLEDRASDEAILDDEIGIEESLNNFDTELGSTVDEVSLDAELGSTVDEIGLDTALDTAIDEIGLDAELDTAIDEIGLDTALNDATVDDMSLNSDLDTLGLDEAESNELGLGEIDTTTSDELSVEDTPAKESATVVEEPVAAEPNKIMSPDEIAALIANTTASSTPEIEKPAKPEVQEKKAPEPDLSNPNKIMSPDEIAALIASI